MINYKIFVINKNGSISNAKRMVKKKNIRTTAIAPLLLKPKSLEIPYIPAKYTKATMKEFNGVFICNEDSKSDSPKVSKGVYTKSRKKPKRMYLLTPGCLLPGL
ncbi:hypothetical protein HS5_04340 [Acidianus sp. HS-5]|nr:hypothetical protein HS5_04340 [Acidianus sp. HS-5]